MESAVFDLHASLAEPVGRINRNPEACGRKKDRAIAVRYGARPIARHRSAQWSKIEEWALSHDVSLGTIVIHDPHELRMPAWERPSLIRFAAITLLPLKGDVLIDNWKMLGDDDLGRAVVLDYLLGNNRHAAVRIDVDHRNEITQARLYRLCRNVDGARFEEARDRFQQVYMRELLHLIKTDAEDLIYFGRGPDRDAKQALIDALLRREAGWSNARIRSYLELYGYTNTSGTVGRWSHEQFHRLWT
ncbi:hypothetical protein [Streptosporangium sp. NBC_01756]|uniref:hypothetical protein n=1 Tax=Streptosporangium sp. NBC_01756 TaxID=2975950 RepID=UPI002DDA5258|nr:hypothetical protein [Streptosporangium sp. NBC_01756]WSC89454.1 hypothetical protein OIE48_15100 [Streptosporangium sp. NBC_01756]